MLQTHKQVVVKEVGYRKQRRLKFKTNHFYLNIYEVYKEISNNQVFNAQILEKTIQVNFLLTTSLLVTTKNNNNKSPNKILDMFTYYIN